MPIAGKAGEAEDSRIFWVKENHLNGFLRDYEPVSSIRHARRVCLRESGERVFIQVKSLYKSCPAICRRISVFKDFSGFPLPRLLYSITTQRESAPNNLGDDAIIKNPISL